ncbi:hypothetical protein PVAND_004680 [Polypedilum vanderplanki]|uniref:Uncharacterized protein n=1 Tax=Polypedilum vanderplanki TaxID=319348 RepID=A0A9J6BYG3_POLVA|nr:hypothetical protein PVAND_004680 [Polypedilum vanderplanki]
MTKHEGPLQSNGGDSAGCSVESSPVDSLLDDQELVSPTPSSLADLSSPDPQELHEVLRSYPRGIINPNYPGFQHLAHTLAEHFIGHTYESNSSDSEISDDVDFDVTYRVGNLSNVNINMNDSNNNINAAAAAVAAIDLNRNKNNFGSGVGDSKEFEDGNVNLLMKSEPKVFCESKQLGLHDENQNSDYEHFTSDDEDEECCNLQKNSTEPQQMEFDEDEIADLSGEDDAAIKNELERIDRADNDFTESINCDLATYLQQYDYKMDLEKSYQLEECLTDEDNNKLPTPDILIEHNSNCNNKKVQNDEEKEEETIKTNLGSENDSKSTENLLQPDLIKSVTDTINTNDNNHEKAVMQSEISSPTENETNDNDVKIINQVQTEFAMANCSTKLSFDSATSAVDIIGDFGKEVEKEIGLIVSGYLNATNEVVETPSSPTNIENFIRPDDNSKADESVYDEKQFFEHLKCFSKMGDATLSKVEERIPLKNTLVVADEHDESNVIPTKDDSLIPTAIVKPKYQKLSFDERQLPIRGATETELLATSATITTTPRKVQKHLPKSQKHARKFVNTRASELSDNKEIISENIDCNSVAIVQPIKKVIDTNILRNEEEEEIERAKNSTKQELKIRNSKINEKKMSDFGGNNNLNVGNRKCFEREKEKFDVVMSREEKVDVVENDKKVPMKSQKNHNDAFDVYNIETALPVIDLEAIESHLMASAKEEEMKVGN